MGFIVARELERARAVLRDRLPQVVEKTIWGSPAGKKRLAKRLSALLPAHRTYVEPFAGSGAVLFAKEPATVEAIGDADPEIASAFLALKNMTPQKLGRLRRMSWKGDEATFKRLIGAKPKGEVEKLHRFLYLSHFSYGKLRGKSFNHNAAGIEANTMRRIEQFAPRLKKVHVHSGNYLPLIRKYDAKDAAFFLDPPYAGYNVQVGEDAFDEEEFYDVLKSIKGRWLLTYGIRGKLPKLLKGSKFEVKRIRTQRGIRSMRGVGGPSVLTQLLVANYSLTKKCEWLEPWDGQLEGAATRAPGVEAFDRSIALIKGADPEDERYVLGVVLEPDVVDAQQDTYSSDEIRKAAHRFMEAFRGIGLQHQMRVNDQVKILETYLAPTDFTVADVSIRKGTWLFAVRILSDELWELVKSGALTGFSIGGSARRVPESGERPPEAA